MRITAATCITILLSEVGEAKEGAGTITTTDVACAAAVERWLVCLAGVWAAEAAAAEQVEVTMAVALAVQEGATTTTGAPSLDIILRTAGVVEERRGDAAFPKVAAAAAADATEEEEEEGAARGAARTTHCDSSAERGKNSRRSSSKRMS